MNIDIFLIGLASIPFDNLPFAPSSGWATVSPIIFFVYCLLNFRLLIKVMMRKHFLSLVCISGAIVFQLILLIFYGVIYSSFMDALRTLVLGVSFYFALIIRYELCHADINSDAKILYKAYVLAFIYGVMWLMVYTFSPSTAELFKIFERRYYRRLAYSFTEPSFITLHTIGVMLLLTYLIHNKKLAMKFVHLSFAFMALSILVASSATCVVHSILLILLMLTRNLFSQQTSISIKISINKHAFRKFIVYILAIFMIIVIFLSSSRINNIADGGTYYDGSLASRWFRINALLHGFINNNIETLSGWGMGNMIIPMRSGMSSALREYTSNFMIEVNKLQKASAVGNIFSLPIRLVAEWGLIITILIFAYFFLKAKKKKIDIYVLVTIFCLYIQNDSYCLYSLWILLYILNYYNPKKHGISFFDLIS